MLVGGAPRADEVTYAVPMTAIELTFEGTVQVLPGPIVAVKHGRFGSVNFLPGEVAYVRKPSVRAELETKLRTAKALKNPNSLIAAGRDALKAGRPELFRESLAALVEIAPGDPTATRMTAFLEAYDTAPAWDADAFARATLGPDGTPAAIARKRCVLYVIDSAPNVESRKLAQRRLLTMERVSETFFFLLALDEADVKLPSRPLVGIWCAQASDFEKLRERLGPSVAETTGFFAPDPGLSVFYDQSTSSRFAPLLALADALRQERDEARRKNSPHLQDIVRRSEAVGLVAKAAQERSDVETVAHESVHQLLALSGIFPTGADPPRSLHEGLATYFEGSGADGWAGPGVLLKERHARLVDLLKSPDACSLVEIVSQSPGPDRPKLDLLDSYAYCWGAAHFLAEHHPAAFYSFCREVGEESEGAKLPPQRIADLLTAAIGKDAAALDVEWRAHVAALAQDEVADDSP